MRRGSVAVVGAAETTRLGVIPDMSQIQLHADAALNAMADAGLRPKDIDGYACASETPVQLAHYLGITPTWVDGTAVGGCSFIMHVHHALAAINAGMFGASAQATEPARKMTMAQSMVTRRP